MESHTVHSRTALIVLGMVLACQLPGRADDATDQYNIASGFYRMDRFEFAAEEYEKYLKDFPKHELVPEGLFFLGESYYHLNKLDMAREKYREVVARFAGARNFHHALYRIGETSNLLSDFKSAEPALREFVAKRPDDMLVEFAMPHLGRAYLRNGKLAESKTTLLRALEKYPKGKLVDQCRFDLASTYEQSGEKEAAAQLYLVLAHDPASRYGDDALLALGTQYFDDKKYEVAFDTFQDLG